MNTVTSEARLFHQLAVTPYTWFQIGFCLLATMMSLEAEGWARWGYPLFLIVFLLNIQVEWENYRAVGMTRIHWRHHRRILVSAAAGIVLLEMLLLATLTDLDMNMLLLLALPAAWMWAMVRHPEPSRTPEEIIRGGDSGVDREAAGKSDEKPSRFPSTPVQQIIRGPQTSMWVTVWGSMAAFAVAVFGVLSWLFGTPPPWLSVIVPLLAVPATWLALGQIGTSLREWVALGGNRRVWARETAALGLLSPLLAGALVVIAGAVFTIAVFDALPLLLGVGLLVPVFFTLLELTDFSRTWWVFLPYAGLGGGLVVLWATDSIGGWSFLVCSLLIYLVHALTLPAVTRNYTVFSGGLSAWFGVRSEVNV